MCLDSILTPVFPACRYRKWVKLSTGHRCPTINYCITFALGSNTCYAVRTSSSGESGTVQVKAAVFLNVFTFFCIVSGVIRDPIYCSGLFFNSFPFRYAYNNFTNSLHEGRVDFLYCFMPLWTCPSHASLSWSAAATLLHILVQSPHGDLGKDDPLIF